MKNAKFVRDVASQARIEAAVGNPGLDDGLPGGHARSGINYDESLEYAVPIEVVHAR